MQNISIRPSGAKGRGVFAEKRFSQGEIVETVPVVEIPDPQYELLEQTSLKDYYLYWTDHTVAVAFGCVSICNHSTQPNAEIRRNTELGLAQIMALKEIHPGEEITVTYYCNPWFKVVE